MKMENTRNEQEFQNIFGAFHGKIHRYLARLIGESEAEDVTQEVFLKIHAALDNFRGESSLSTWIYRIATNAATDHLRKSGTIQPGHMGDEHSKDDADLCEDDTAADRNVPLPDRQLIQKEMNACIRDIVDSLPENYRTVVVLSDIEELSNSEIAEVLNISLETVKIRLHRARVRLKKELERHCSFYKDERNELACDRKVPSIKFLKK